MLDRDYSHRDVIDKLGIKPGYALAVDVASASLDFDPALRERVLNRLGRPLATTDEQLDLILVLMDDTVDETAILVRWRPRLKPPGGIWLLTPKRGWAGYVDQRRLIQAGRAAGVVDNKVCSVSESMSAMRFVIRRTDRMISATAPEGLRVQDENSLPT
ncbi:MAG TPA: DUF3052 family protein [Chloroflexota bacterium]|nr:DUF3052 family protein [Chloroflexota bacterium]